MSARSNLEDLPRRRTYAYDRVWVGAALLFLLSVAVRAIDLNRLPVTDELYTLLAAQGWLEAGAPRIADGIYDRAEAYTLLLAGWLKVFGNTMVSARTLSLVAGSCLVAVAFVWTWRVAGRLAAGVTGVLLALAPLSVDISQFNRFYALHALVFWLAATGACALAAPRPPSGRRWLLIALGTIVGFLFALHLQILTAIGLAGLGLWAVLAVGIPQLRAQDARRQKAVLAAATVLVLLAAAALVSSGTAEELLDRYRETPLWNRAHRNEFWYYHVYFVERWPTFWSLTPLAILLGLVHRPRVAVFCTCIFVVSFVLLSFGGMKDPRYMFFALPFLFVLWGIALSWVFDHVRPWLVGTTDRLLRRLAPYLAGRPIRNGLIAAGLVFLLASNGGAVKALMSLAGMRLIAAEGGGIGVSADAGRADWAASEAPLRAWLDTASIILTSRDVHFLHYLGDYDVALNNSRLTEIAGGEFDLDPRTGRPVVGSAEALGRIIDCFPTGLITTDVSSWRQRAGIADPVADVIEARTSPIDLPQGSGIMAFHWEHERAELTPQCAALRQQLAAGRAPAERGDT